MVCRWVHLGGRYARVENRWCASREDVAVGRTVQNERQAEEKRRHGKMWADNSVEVDDNETVGDDLGSEESEDDEADSAKVEAQGQDEVSAQTPPQSAWRSNEHVSSNMSPPYAKTKG